VAPTSFSARRCGLHHTLTTLVENVAITQPSVDNGQSELAATLREDRAVSVGIELRLPSVVLLITL
jgi:hypothetical protein